MAARRLHQLAAKSVGTTINQTNRLNSPAELKGKGMIFEWNLGGQLRVIGLAKLQFPKSICLTAFS